MICNEVNTGRRTFENMHILMILRIILLNVAEYTQKNPYMKIETYTYFPEVHIGISVLAKCTPHFSEREFTCG